MFWSTLLWSPQKLLNRRQASSLTSQIWLVEYIKRNDAIFEKNHNTQMLLAHISCLARIEMSSLPADGINLKSFAIQFNGHSPASRLNRKSEPQLSCLRRQSAGSAFCVLSPRSKIKTCCGRDLCPGNLLRAARKISPSERPAASLERRIAPTSPARSMDLCNYCVSGDVTRDPSPRWSQAVGSWEAAGGGRS